MLGEFGLAWPWESLHVEALAWFDHWLKGQDTGILEGPPIRYVVPEAPGWRTAATWPIAGTTYTEMALRADGVLADTDGSPGSRTLMVLGAGLNRPRASEIDPPDSLSWTTASLDRDFEIVGDIELQLDATSTASDTAWIVFLQDVDASGAVTEVSAGYLRGSMRAVDESTSRIGAPALRCNAPQLVPIGQPVRYRIPLVANARRFKAGHRVRLYVTSDDQNPDTPAMMTYRHASVGTSSLNTIMSSSRLLLPILPHSAV
jgi:predicted acyl esterase